VDEREKAGKVLCQFLAIGKNLVKPFPRSGLVFDVCIRSFNEEHTLSSRYTFRASLVSVV
jgi:hypothetical protein